MKGSITGLPAKSEYQILPFQYSHSLAKQVEGKFLPDHGKLPDHGDPPIRRGDLPGSCCPDKGSPEEDRSLVNHYQQLVSILPSGHHKTFFLDLLRSIGPEKGPESPKSILLTLQPITLTSCPITISVDRGYSYAVLDGREMKFRLRGGPEITYLLLSDDAYLTYEQAYRMLSIVPRAITIHVY
jgi:hypothetical protein